MLKEKGRERIFEIFFLIVASISILCALVICLFLFIRGVPAMFEIGLFDFIFGMNWYPSRETNPEFGIFPMIAGSVYITVGAVVIGVPIGVLTAIYITKYCPKKIYKILKPAIELMAGIPSIIYGFFGMVVLVPFIDKFFEQLEIWTTDPATGDPYGLFARTLYRPNGNPYVESIFATDGQSILTASILLGIMILPTIINLSESAIRAVPEFYYEGARALGSTHERSIFKVVLPAAKSGIMASIVLGVGRAIGETMAVIMVAGNQSRFTTNILDGIKTLTANVVMEMKYAADLHEEALIATGVVLFVFILIINLSFSYIKRKVGKY